MWMTTKEAAEYLGVSARTVRRRAENGEWKTDYVTGKSGKELRIFILREPQDDIIKSECEKCKESHPFCDKCCKTCDEPCPSIQNCRIDILRQAQDDTLREPQRDNSREKKRLRNMSPGDEAGDTDSGHLRTYLRTYLRTPPDMDLRQTCGHKKCGGHCLYREVGSTCGQLLQL